MIDVRAKGKNGELEVVSIINDELGLNVRRNLEQCADGGSDIIGFKPWAIEVKRGKKFRHEWWTQTAEQAVRQKEKPVLIFRLDYHAWRAVVCLSDITDFVFHYRVEMDLKTFCNVARELM